MLGYILPTEEGKRVLWYPAPRWPLGELKGLGSTVTLLSPDPDIDISKVPLMTHDNAYRPVVRKAFSRRFFNSWIGRAMLWGCIWLIGRTASESALEGIVSGLYLLIAEPLFFRLSADVQKKHAAGVLAKFNELFYAPNDVEVVYSPRLEKLEDIIKSDGIIKSLEVLDTLGLMHLREFYRRVAWSGRWEVGPPTGQGVLK